MTRPNPIVDILIVEDSDSKLESIRGVLSRDFPSASIRYACSVKSAIDALSVLPDIAVVDMSLPTYDIEEKEKGGSPRPFGGIEVFEHLARYEIVLPVLVVTSYSALTDGNQSMDVEELSDRLKEEFPECFLGAVYFDSAYAIWEQEMSQFMNMIQRDKYES